MTKLHWGAMFLLFFIGYMVAIWYPGPGAMLKAKIGL
jgi:hypothetical protein